MTLVDTSVWIDIIRRDGLSLASDRFVGIATCGPVVQEILQGMRDEPRVHRFRWDLLSLTMLSDPLPVALFTAAADIHRTIRAKGFTVRSTVDCLIAAIAIDNQVPVWHRDRDFDLIARFTALKTVTAV